MAEIKASGYSENDRLQILKSGVTRNEKLRKQEKEGLRPFYREKNFHRNERERKRKATRSLTGSKGMIINLHLFSLFHPHLGVC